MNQSALLSVLIITVHTALSQWQPQNSFTNLNLNNVYFFDAINGWAVGDSGIILHTDDAGKEWEEQPIETTKDFNRVCFTNTENGWIVGDSGTILYTNNGGTVGIEELEVLSFESQVLSYPNPFSTSTTLSYELKKPSIVHFSIYNQLGQIVYQTEERQQKGFLSALLMFSHFSASYCSDTHF